MAWKIISWGIEEFKSLIAIFLYLYVVFGLFNIHEYVVLRQHRLDFTSYGFAFINAAVFSKVVMVAETARLGARFEKYPLIYLVMVKAVLFGAALILFHVAEHTVVGLWHGESLLASLPRIGGGGLLGILAVSALVSVALIPYFAFRGVLRILGGPSVRTLLFTRSPNVAIEQRRQ